MDESTYNLEDTIARSKKRIKKLISDFKKEKRYLKLLESKTQPTNEELTKEFYSEKYFKIEFNNGNYEHILGGDGCSGPWSEIRTGIICTLIIKKNIYLSYDQVEIINTITRRTDKFNQFTIKSEE